MNYAHFKILNNDIYIILNMIQILNNSKLKKNEIFEVTQYVRTPKHLTPNVGNRKKIFVSQYFIII